MDFSKILVLLIATLSCLLLHTNSAVTLPHSIQSEVLKLCKNTTDPKLCVQTILPQIRDHDPFNPYNALEAEIKATEKQIRKISGVIDWLIANPRSYNYSKDVSGSLSDCKELYADMMDDIKETVGEVASRNVIEARVKFSAVLSYQQTCEDAFKKGASPFAKDSNLLFQLGGNCLDIMAAIEDGEKGPNPPSPPTVYPAPPDPCQHVIGTCPPLSSQIPKVEG